MPRDTLISDEPARHGNPYQTREQCYMTVSKSANLNNDLTNLILNKVILPGLGASKENIAEENATTTLVCFGMILNHTHARR